MRSLTPLSYNDKINPDVLKASGKRLKVTVGQVWAWTTSTWRPPNLAFPWSMHREQARNPWLNLRSVTFLLPFVTSPADRSLRDGKKSDMKGSELAGKALGLIGFGRIAQSVGRIAQSIGMSHATTLSPPKIAKAQDTRLHKTVDALLLSARMSPLLQSHGGNPPSRQQETHRIDAPSGRDGRCRSTSSIARAVSSMKRPSWMHCPQVPHLNCSMFLTEPVDPTTLCFNSNTFTGTPHIGASTVEAKVAGMDIVTNVLDILAGLPSDFVVNNEHL